MSKIYDNSWFLFLFKIRSVQITQLSCYLNESTYSIIINNNLMFALQHIQNNCVLFRHGPLFCCKQYSLHGLCNIYAYQLFTSIEAEFIFRYLIIRN